MQECELTTRYLLCQDVIFHRNINITDRDIQRTPLSYVDEQMTMIKLQKKDKLVPNRQNNDICRHRNLSETKF